MRTLGDGVREREIDLESHLDRIGTKQIQLWDRHPVHADCELFRRGQLLKKQLYTAAGYPGAGE